MTLDTPISVVGASIIGGDTVDHGLWVAFWFFLAQLNFILGAINLVPLLPFDGGHIAIAVFEKFRNMIRSARGKVAAAPVNYLKLMPATYVVLVLVVGYMLLTVTADWSTRSGCSNRPAVPVDRSERRQTVTTGLGMPAAAGAHAGAAAQDAPADGPRRRGRQRLSDLGAVDVHHQDP